MGKMTVYHGGYAAVKNPKVIIGKNTHQINFCTEAAMKCLEFVSSEEVIL